MSLLLRKVNNLNRTKRPDWLTESEVPGIMVKEFAPRDPNERGLSVWWLDDERDNLDDVIAAIILAPGQKLRPIHYLTFPKEIVAGCGLKLKQTDGLTHHMEAAVYHHEIRGLTALTVGKLTHEACINEGFPREVLTDADVLERTVKVVRQDDSILDRVGRSSPLGERILDQLNGR